MTEPLRDLVAILNSTAPEIQSLPSQTQLSVSRPFCVIVTLAMRASFTSHLSLYYRLSPRLTHIQNARSPPGQIPNPILTMQFPHSTPPIPTNSPTPKSISRNHPTPRNQAHSFPTPSTQWRLKTPAGNHRVPHPTKPQHNRTIH